MSDVIPGPDDRTLLPITGQPPNCIRDPDGVHIWRFHDCDGGVKYGMTANRNPVCCRLEASTDGRSSMPPRSMSSRPSSARLPKAAAPTDSSASASGSPHDAKEKQ